ncbi:MAG TPA: class I SAM-dependent methyltransferase [Rhodanobacteraceae bacterium]|nr:class I SAM-dependent methyltransferase [Rhodanobacteraceae bacterium]
MESEELKVLFDQHAAGYDDQQAKMAPIVEGMYFALDSVLCDLPHDARILCVGSGTGAEIAHLAKKFPGWRFTAVEPSSAMLDVCRHRAEKEGFIVRCNFHEGYLDSLPGEDTHDAATCFLVSQFILDQGARSKFFRAIADRLHPGGILASSDLASGAAPYEYDALLHSWLNMMSAVGVTPGGLEQMRVAYARDVAVLPPGVVASIIEAGGFETPVRFFQAGLLHAWFARHSSGNTA